VENDRLNTGKFSHLTISAMISVIAVVALVGWRFGGFMYPSTTDTVVAETTDEITGTPMYGQEAGTDAIFTTPDVATSSSPEYIARLGDNIVGTLASYYTVLSANGIYTPQMGDMVAASLVPDLLQTRVAYSMYDARSIPTDPDTSPRRMTMYRTDLQKSLAPLKKNTEYEFKIFATYTASQDPKYLAQLKVAAQNYRDAAALTAKVVVPADAVTDQVGILNAMLQFAATLDAMADNANDAMTSLVLVNTYNEAESDMFASFNALNAYYAKKQSS
jgi:hypothetical protein